MQNELRVVGAGVSPVSQAELDSLIGLANQIRRFTALYNQGCCDLMERLLRGAAVDPGTHIAELEEFHEGPSHTTKLVLS